MKKITLLTICLLFATLNSVMAASKTYELLSPNGTIALKVSLSKGALSYTVECSGEVLLAPSTLAMELSGGKVLGEGISKVRRSKYSSMATQSPSPLYITEEVVENYNQLQMWFAGDYSVIFRAYDNGVAYRFLTDIKGEVVVENERATFNFAGDATLWASHSNSSATDIEGQYSNSFENFYKVLPISEQDATRLILTPALAQPSDSYKVLITEADLIDYPGMYLLADAKSNSLVADFAEYPTECEQGGHNDIQSMVTRRADYIAKCEGSRAFPWRVVAISQNDGDLLTSTLAYQLSSPSALDDISWIEGGAVAWDWWCDWNLSGVDFKAGINTQTYKYYIDFASRFSLEYIILDEGWAVPNYDLLSVTPEVDIEEIVKYGNEKGVGVILWAGYWGLEADTERVVSHYAEMGVKGFKVDFFDRDDQQMLSSVERIAKICADHKMVLDLHGHSKPAGLQRLYPNIINFEGISGLEQLKWSDPKTTDMVTHDVTFPFIRMFNGAVDYTQGAMRNTIKGDYNPSNSNPMSQGTRCRQLAAYVVFYSPLVMLCDSPTLYEAESEIPTLLGTLPTVWDETKVIQATIGDNIVIARRSGESWYVGGMINWEAREISLPFDFLSEGSYQMELYCDGINAAKCATDYRVTRKEVNSKDNYTVEVAPGGGFLAKITPILDDAEN